MGASGRSRRVWARAKSRLLHFHFATSTVFSRATIDYRDALVRSLNEGRYRQDLHFLANIMISTKLVAAALLGLSLLGCKPSDPPIALRERALTNLREHLKDTGGATRLIPRYCDDGGFESPTLLCHADVMRQNAGEETKIASSTFSCSTAPEGRCLSVRVADAGTAATERSDAAPACADPLHPMATVELQDVGPVSVSDYTARDMPDQAWVNASFTLQDASIRLTEAQVKTALDRLFDRIAAICRSYPLQKTRVFLYPAGVTAGESANWIARLDAADSRSIDIHQSLLKDERADRYACLNEKEPGIGLEDGTKLPPVRQREIIGTWVGMRPNITMSLERVKGKVYRVYRSPYCASGDRGELLQTRSNARYAVIDSRSGDYYQVTPTGDLGVFDRDGSIDVMPKHFALHPATSTK